MKIVNLEIQNLKSFGADLVGIKSLGNFNIFIGKNNSGKSNITEAVNIVFNGININNSFLKFDDNINSIDKNYWFKQKSSENGKFIPISINLDVLFNDDEWNLLFNGFSHINEVKNFIDANKEKEITISIQILTSDDKNTIIRLNYIRVKETALIQPVKDKESRFYNFKSKIFTSGDNYRIIPNLNIIFQNSFKNIQAIKKANQDIANVFQQYETDLTKDKQHVFEKINESIQKLFPDFDQTKTFKYGKGNEIHMKANQINLPLSCHGSGIEQIFMVLFYLYSEEPKIIAIQEPESHLHSGEQRKLFEFLKKISVEEGKQIFITTHSTVFVDNMDLSNVYLVKKDKESGTIIKDLDKKGQYDILEELGVKPSDVLQTDAIIFVEGPSDVGIYKEFFDKGGIDLNKSNICLLHLGGVENIKHIDIKDLIGINKNFMIILDSDKRNKKEKLSQVKIDIKNKCKKYGKECFILSKRCIENYLTKRAISNVLQLRENSINLGDFNDMRETIKDAAKKDGKKLEYKKIKHGKKIAKVMTKEELNEDIKEIIKKAGKLVGISDISTQELKDVRGDYQKAIQDWKDKSYLTSEDHLDKFFQFRGELKLNNEDFNFILRSVFSTRGDSDKWIKFIGKEKLIEIGLDIIKNEKKENIISTAIWALGQIKDERVTSALIEIIEKNENDDICDTTIYQFAFGLVDKRVINPLLKIINVSPNHKLRKAAAYALGSYKEEKVVDALITALGDSRADVRAEASYSLGRIKSEKAIDPMIKSFTGEQGIRVKKNLISSLGNFKQKKIVTFLNSILKTDGDSRIKEEVKFALIKINQRVKK